MENSVENTTDGNINYDTKGSTDVRKTADVKKGIKQNIEHIPQCRKSKARRKYEQNRMYEYNTKKNNITTLATMDKYFKLVFEYGVNITLDDYDNIDQVYEDCINSGQLMIAAKAAKLLDTATFSASTSFEGRVFSQEVQGLTDESTYVLGTVSNKISADEKEFMAIRYPDVNAGVCEECGFEVVLCSCQITVTLENLYDVRPSALNEVSPADRAVKLSINQELLPEAIRLGVKTPIVVRTKFIRAEFFDVGLYQDVTMFHYSYLFPDRYPEGLVKILPLLDCNTKFLLFSEVPVLSLVYRQLYGQDRECTRRGFCKAKFNYVLGGMSILQYIYMLSVKKKSCLINAYRSLPRVRKKTSIGYLVVEES